MADVRRVSFGRMLGRAVLRRCPRCGGRGAWFTGWFQRADRCRTCGYRYERQEGFMLGAITINTILTFGAILVVLVVGIIVGYPDLPVVPIVAGCVAVAVVVPIVAFPFTHTIWGAVDLAMHPLEPAEVADAPPRRSTRSAGRARVLERTGVRSYDPVVRRESPSHGPLTPLEPSTVGPTTV